MTRPARVFLVAGELSGDQLGAALIRALRADAPDTAFEGVGGPAMTREGLSSLFPLAEVTAMGVVGILAGLPRIVRRGLQTVDAIVSSRPDILVVVDSPDLTHAIARRVRRRLPGLPIVNYVSPTVWAWRPGRARRMRAYIDHVLALKPFEPAAHLRLGGPPCTYVGHPLVEQVGKLRPVPGERPKLGVADPTLLVLPGSRRSEIRRLMTPFGEAVAAVTSSSPRPVRVIVPAVAHLAAEIEARAAEWPVRPAIVVGDDAKHAAFRGATAALAASGTVTLELALAGVPTIVGYRVSPLEWPLRFLIDVPSIVLANLMVGENVVPEFIQGRCTPARLATALRPLLDDSPERRRQIEAFGRLDDIMEIGAAETPSERAAAIVWRELERARQPRCDTVG